MRYCVFLRAKNARSGEGEMIQTLEERDGINMCRCKVCICMISSDVIKELDLKRIKRFDESTTRVSLH